MTNDDANDLAQVIRANRFHLQAAGIRPIADMLEKKIPGFDRARWFARIEGKPWQPKTGAPCGCRPGVGRDNCPACEGTGQRIDFAAIRAAR